MHQRVSTVEVVVYFTVYIVYIVIGLYKICALRDRIYALAQFEFANGWTYLQRPRDDSNDELENFTYFIKTNWPWYLLHVCVSIITDLNCSKRWQNYGHAIVCILALKFNLQWSSLLLVLALLFSFYASLRWHTKKRVWLLAGIWMLVINVIKLSSYWYEHIGYVEYFTLIIIISWSLLRCCSFALTRLNDTNVEAATTTTMAAAATHEQYYNLRQFVGYTLYFPCIAYGPFISYKRFMYSCHPIEQQLSERLQNLIWQLARCLAWWLLMQYALHYLYIHYMARDVRTLPLIGSIFWQHAVGYFMGQFFFLFYVITYGFGIAFAHFDGLNAPNKPRCIGRIHFYSDMWKHFDEGLYDFLFGHIYVELCSKNSKVWRKFFATAVTFSFVYVWHGCYSYVLIWSVLNFICLAAEKIFTALVTAPVYTKWTLAKLGPIGAQRLYALLATQLFIPAAYSNVYFISGQEVGNFLMRGVYLSGFWNYVALSFCSYCFFQCSELLLCKSKISFNN